MKPYRVEGWLAEAIVKTRERILSVLEARLDRKEVIAAKNDYHARREPIACGLTVHTGIGCRYGCLYCYVPDMGFPMKPRPYPLNGLQLAYALASNPFFVPGPYGTMLAFGSVTEPFMEETKERALEYLKAVRDYLGNPTQIATKSYLDPYDAERFRKAAEERVSVLVTIITFRYAARLEPGAPPPEKRLETIANLSKLGVHVSLFLRPIIPGVTEGEVRAIIEAAREAGVRGIVPGSLRVTPGILKRLRAAGFDVTAIVSRLPRRPRNNRDQVTIRERDLKEYAVKVARELGVKVYPSSCSANMDAHGLSCWICGWGPCGDPSKLPIADPEGVRDFVEAMGYRVKSVRVRRNIIDVSVAGKLEKKEARRIYHWLSTIAKRNVVVKEAM